MAMQRRRDGRIARAPEQCPLDGQPELQSLRAARLEELDPDGRRMADRSSWRHSALFGHLYAGRQRRRAIERRSYSPNCRRLASRLGGGIGNAIQGTVVTVAIASLISIPIALFAAVYLAEFRPDSRIRRLGAVPVEGVSPAFLRFSPASSSTPPSFLLMGTYSALAGGIALAVLMLPTVTLTAEGAMRMVPQKMKDAAIGMGCTNAQVVWSVTLPTALPSIVTGVILAVARVAGEVRAACCLRLCSATTGCAASRSRQRRSRS